MNAESIQKKLLSSFHKARLLKTVGHDCLGVTDYSWGREGGVTEFSGNVRFQVLTAVSMKIELSGMQHHIVS
jgi:hypothetical protein